VYHVTLSGMVILTTSIQHWCAKFHMSELLHIWLLIWTLL